jgi:hypothetical protein
MTNKLDDFFNSKGIKKQTPEFTPNQEAEIQSVIDLIIKPAFEELGGDFSSYSNIKGQVSTSKKSTDSIRENIELKVFKTMQAKFFYKPKFSVTDNQLYVTGQFCIPNLYGECTSYTNTNLKLTLANLTGDNLKTDVISAFTDNVDIQ